MVATTAQRENIVLELGAMGDPLPAQFTRHGLKFDPEQLDVLEQDRRALGRLVVRGILKDQEIKRAHRRFINKVQAFIIAQN